MKMTFYALLTKIGAIQQSLLGLRPGMAFGGQVEVKKHDMLTLFLRPMFH